MELALRRCPPTHMACRCDPRIGGPRAAHRPSPIVVAGRGKTIVSILASLLLLPLLLSPSFRRPPAASASVVPVPPTFRRPPSLVATKAAGRNSRRPEGGRPRRRRSPTPSVDHPLLLASSKSSSRRRRSGAGRKANPPASSSPEPPSIRDEGEAGPTLEEMRASLGPLGLLVASGVEVGVVTAGSYLSGGILGYVLGGFVATPSLFRPSDVVNPDRLPSRTALGEVGGRLKNWNSKAVGTCKTWAELSAAFSGFHALSRVVRGGKEDQWNGILGSAAAGAYFGRKGGPKAMVQGAATYGAFTYLLDKMFANPKGTRTTVDGHVVDDEFDFRDRPVVEERGF